MAKKRKKCSCGSGKRPNKCCANNRKPRFVQLEFTPKNREVISDSLSYDPKSNTVTLLKQGQPVPMENVSVKHGYDRDKKIKVISQAHYLEGESVYNTPDAVLLKYDYIYAIDTNTKIINGEKISVSSVAQIFVDFPKFSAGFIHRAELRDLKWQAEKYCWIILIGSLMRQHKDFNNQRYAIIVDSLLDNINSYNSQKIPLCGVCHLPENIDLIYASVDKPNDSFMNRSIHECDKDASAIFREIEKHPEDNKFRFVAGTPLKRYRIWTK